MDAGLGRLRRPPASPIDFVGINGALASPAWLVKNGVVRTYEARRDAW
ncbi:MAG: hypothetical protein WCD86_13200 [Ktedonobacteraceae bacterium]